MTVAPACQAVCFVQGPTGVFGGDLGGLLEEIFWFWKIPLRFLSSNKNSQTTCNRLYPLCRRSKRVEHTVEMLFRQLKYEN
jgi:hypothetical protein